MGLRTPTRIRPGTAAPEDPAPLPRKSTLGFLLLFLLLAGYLGALGYFQYKGLEAREFAEFVLDEATQRQRMINDLLALTIPDPAYQGGPSK